MVWRQSCPGEWKVSRIDTHQSLSWITKPRAILHVLVSAQLAGTPRLLGWPWESHVESDGATRWREARPLSHIMEESCTTRSISPGLLRDQDANFQCGKLLRRGDLSVIAAYILLTNVPETWFCSPSQRSRCVPENTRAGRTLNFQKGRATYF